MRYLDGDLFFNGNIRDGGGRLFAGETEILFETDSATGSSAETTFVGITGQGGSNQVSNRFEIDAFSGLRERIVNGTALDNTVAGDGSYQFATRQIILNNGVSTLTERLHEPS